MAPRGIVHDDVSPRTSPFELVSSGLTGSGVNKFDMSPGCPLIDLPSRSSSRPQHDVLTRSLMSRFCSLSSLQDISSTRPGMRRSHALASLESHASPGSVVGRSRSLNSLRLHDDSSPSASEVSSLSSGQVGYPLSDDSASGNPPDLHDAARHTDSSSSGGEEKKRDAAS